MKLWKEMELNLFRFKNRLAPLTKIGIGLEEYLISNYRYRYTDTTFIKLASDYILNHFYKTDRSYDYKDVFVFFRESDLIKHIENFKNLLDIFILHHTEPFFTDLFVESILVDEDNKLIVKIRYSIDELNL